MSTVCIFGHYVRGQFLLLAVVEFFILAASVYAGALIRFAGDVNAAEAAIGWILPRALLFAMLTGSALTAMGMYHPNLREGFLGALLRIIASIILGAVAMAICVYIFPSLYLGRGSLAIAGAVALVAIGIERAFVFTSVGERVFRRRILVLGAGAQANSILDMRRRADWRGFELLGFVPVNDDPDIVRSNRILVIEKTLAEFAIEKSIDQIVVAVDDRRNKIPLTQLLECKMLGIEVLDVFAFFERQFGKLRLDLLRPSHLIFSDGFRVHHFYQHAKLSLDLMMGILVLAVTWPVMVVTALAILIESKGKGPILYRQVRVGQNGRLFNILKFRSMRVDAEQEQGARWAQPNDNRITRVGAILRKFRIDELPQIFNILRGEMSFVGPRPERPEFVTKLRETIPFYIERHRVKAGMSGWAQLCYPYGASEKDAMEKLQYDLYYVKNNSMFLDLLILLQTAEVVLFRKGAR